VVFAVPRGPFARIGGRFIYACVRIEVPSYLCPSCFDLRPGCPKGIAHLCLFTNRASLLLSFHLSRAEEATPLLHAACVEGAAYLCFCITQASTLLSFHLRKAEEGAYPLYVFKFL
jgi:hypothetical protein